MMHLPDFQEPFWRVEILYYDDRYHWKLYCGKATECQSPDQGYATDTEAIYTIRSLFGKYITILKPLYVDDRK